MVDYFRVNHIGSHVKKRLKCKRTNDLVMLKSLADGKKVKFIYTP
jgi:hypothetical protein